MTDYEFNWNEKGMYWTVMCPTCGNPVTITTKRYQAIKRGLEGMACANEGSEHWCTFTKAGAEAIRKDELKRIEETSCSIPG